MGQAPGKVVVASEQPVAALLAVDHEGHVVPLEYKPFAVSFGDGSDTQTLRSVGALHRAVDMAGRVGHELRGEPLGAPALTLAGNAMAAAFDLARAAVSADLATELETLVGTGEKMPSSKMELRIVESQLSSWAKAVLATANGVLQGRLAAASDRS